MASHHISLAKAAFGASLFRADVTKVTREDLTKFHEVFDATLACCSRHNVQKCKEWLLDNVIVSSARTAAFGKFLATVSRHLVSPASDYANHSLQRRRLHILYLLNDLLHHAQYHSSEAHHQANLTQSLRPYLLELFQLTAKEAKPRTIRRVHDIVTIWKEAGYFEDHVLLRLLDPMDAESQESTHEVQEQNKGSSPIKESPYILPATHGDPSSPFWDLPAGNLMPHIVPNSLQPIRSEQIRALQLSAGPADDSLVHALKDFLEEIKSMDNAIASLEDKGVSVDVDEMGQISYRNETGDQVGDTYYGWSRSFCEKMRKRDMSEDDDSLRSRSRDSRRSRSNVAYKRRRYSDSSDDRSMRSYSRSRSRRRNDNDRQRQSPSGSREYSPVPALPETGHTSDSERCRLHIGNLPYAATESDLKLFFADYDVESVFLPTNPRTNRPAGYGFVNLKTPAQAEKASQSLSGREILDRKVSVQIAHTNDHASTNNDGLPCSHNGNLHTFGQPQRSELRPPINSATAFAALPPDQAFAAPPLLQPGNFPVPPPNWQGTWPPPPPPPPYLAGGAPFNNIPFPPPPPPAFPPQSGTWSSYPRPPQSSHRNDRAGPP
ncbi:hypothetical protein PV08_01949 [Exophiala spinifera]|uniref:CID domain-containing protein n=1 Tax=Exophiala spinifera TaxID=91928 RepID=A0A0D2CCY7_9EURO|nr:uncharacterized protein PV08_01949 [Exophiala spinifera]KIW21369.1 hypothetical protein PV08_01949 [Exophiala spinifera]